jgi:hypothetical protein
MPHVDQDLPAAFPVGSFFDGIGLKAQGRIEQQAIDVVIKAGQGDFRSLVFFVGNVEHDLHEVAADAAAPGRGGDDDVADGAGPSFLPEVEIGKADDFSVPLHHSGVGAFADRLLELLDSEGISGGRKHKEKFGSIFWKAADQGQVFFFDGPMGQVHGENLVFRHLSCTLKYNILLSQEQQ